jgi:hypothetical protein
MEITFKEVIKIDNLLLSVRSFNTLRSINIETVNDLLHFYHQNHDFLRIRNCGYKTNEELKSVCVSILTHGLNAPEIKNDNIKQTIERVSARIIWDDLDHLKKEYLGNYYKIECRRLSNRSQNRLREIEEKINWHEHIFDPFDYRTIPNLGANCLDEINHLRDVMKDIVIRVSSEDFINIKLQNLAAVFNIRIKTNNSVQANELESCLFRDGNIKPFRLLKYFIENDRFFNPLHQDIQKKSFYLKEISDNINIDKYNKTSERIRQLKEDYLENFRDKYTLLSDIEKSALERYISFNNSPIIVVDDSLTNYINQAEDVQFNSTFYYLYFSTFYNDIIYPIGNIKSGKHLGHFDKRIKSLYLINKMAANKIDFKKLNDSLSKINHQDVIYEDFKELIKSLNIDDDIIIASEVIKQYMEREYGLIVTSEDIIKRKFSHNRKLVDLVYEIICEIGGPVNIDIILKKLCSDQYNCSVDKEVLRSIITKHKEYFICFGRTSTYGLKSWENEKDDIKGGTIRSIVKEYLESKDFPCHMYEICEHVKKYRKGTHQTSVYRNIEAEQYNTFTFFSGGFIGLKDKPYLEENLTFKKMSGMHYSKKVLEKYSGWLLKTFIEEYSRLYGYSEAQIRSVISEKEKNGTISMKDGYLIILSSNH